MSNSDGQQNYPSVEFWWEKIEGNLRRANTKPSMHFRRANKSTSMDFRKRNTKLSMHFRRANTEIECKSEPKSWKGRGFTQEIPQSHPAVQALQKISPSLLF